MNSEAMAQSLHRTGTVVSRVGLTGCFFIFDLLYGAEYLVCHLRHPCVA